MQQAREAQALGRPERQPQQAREAQAAGRPGLQRAQEALAPGRPGLQRAQGATVQVQQERQQLQECEGEGGRAERKARHLPGQARGTRPKMRSKQRNTIPHPGPGENQHTSGARRRGTWSSRARVGRHGAKCRGHSPYRAQSSEAGPGTDYAWEQRQRRARRQSQTLPTAHQVGQQNQRWRHRSGDHG